MHSGLPEVERGCGLMVALECRQDVESLAAWLDCEEEGVRPAIGVVVPPEPAVLVEVAKLPARIDPVVDRRELLPGRILPDHVIRKLLERTAIQATMDFVLRSFAISAPDQRDEDLLWTAVMVACRGGQIASWSKQAAVSRSSLYGWCREHSLPPPGRLLRSLRVEFVDRLVDRGWSRTEAAQLGGWMDAKKFYDVRSRLRRWVERHQ